MNDITPLIWIVGLAAVILFVGGASFHSKFISHPKPSVVIRHVHVAAPTLFDEVFDPHPMVPVGSNVFVK